MSEDELFGNIIFVVGAGGSSAGYTLANGLVGMLRQPGAYKRLCSNPGLVASAAEEVLRWDGSNRNAIARWTTADIEVGGRCIAAGDEVWAVLGAADRDPRVFPDPDVFDVARTPNPHIAFSLGNHFCLGAHLARVEIQASLEAMVRWLPELRLTDDLHWQPNWLIRHLTALPVVWSPAATHA